MNESKRNFDQMLEINKRQKEYYEFDTSEKFELGGNPATSLWNKLRSYQYRMIQSFDANTRLYEIHKKWIGSLEGKKVLELGCHTGSELSEYLAAGAEAYCGVDLSSSALSVLDKQLKNAGINNALLISADILSDDFKEKGFDIIYAKAVFHHFRYFEEFLIRLKSLMNPGGIIVTTDPLNTYLPMRIIRYFYRFMQKDKDWEFPFKRETIAQLEKHFEIENVSGMMGKMKYAFLIYPFSKKLAVKMCKKWTEQDLYHTKLNSRPFWKYMFVSFLLRNSK